MPYDSRDREKRGLVAQWSDRRMRQRSKVQWFGVLLLLGAALAAGGLAALPFAATRAWVDEYAGDGSADPYTPALHGRLQIALAAASVVNLALAVMLFRYRGSAERIGRIRNDVRELRVRCRALRNRLGAGLIAVTVLAAVLRLPYLNQPMRFDESYTYIHYASRPVVILVATYEDPNHHVLHSLLVHAVTRVLGSSPRAIRLPAFLAGVLIAPVTMLLARAAAGRLAAWFAGLLTAVSSPLIEYSTNARGYTLLALLTVACWLVGVLLVRRENRLAWWLLGGGLALGAWTIPVMLYPAMMLLAWMAFSGLRARASRRREILRGLTIAAGVASALTLLMYTPILLVSGPEILARNPYVQPGSWSQYLAGCAATAADAWRLLLRDDAGLSILVLAIGFVYGAVSRRGALLPAIATVLTCVLLTVIQRVLPPARVWLFLVPLAAVVVAAGFAHMATSLTGRARQIAVVSLVLLSVVWPAARCLQSGSVLRSGETGACPDAERIVALLAPILDPREPIICAAPVSASIIYYADRAGVSREHFEPLDAYRQPISPAIAIVSRTPEQTLREVFTELDAPDGLDPETFELVARFPSATVYRRMDAKRK